MSRSILSFGALLLACAGSALLAGCDDSTATPKGTTSGADAQNSGDSAAEVVGGADAETFPPCTTAADCPIAACSDVACIEGLCRSSAKADGTACPIATACASGGICAAGTCIPAGKKACDDGNPCTADSCDEASGYCLHPPNPGAGCDDGNPCTKSDACDGTGHCAGAGNVCTGCASLQDCAAYDDGNPCNGTIYCNTKVVGGVCEVLPGSVVVCEPGDEGPCEQRACNPAHGTCSVLPLEDGLPCEDDNPCTLGDHCQAGACAHNANVCECDADADCAGYEDGNLCNGTLYCDVTTLPHQCKTNPSTVVQCAKGDDPCQLAACDGKTGACSTKPAADGVLCDDGNKATVGDICVGGSCKPGVDTSTCATDLDCLGLEDGDLCNGTMFCNLASSKCEVNPKTAVSCPSVNNTDCVSNVCEKATGLCKMKPAVDGWLCDDGNSCTVGEVCKAGSCVASADTCQCNADSDCAGYEDGNACNGTLYCDQVAHACVVNPATVVQCPTAQNAACIESVCDKFQGTCSMQPVAEGKACDDGNSCTVAEVCKGGSCVASADTCSCKSDLDCAAFEDGDACNGKLFCDLQDGSCKVNPATVVVCPNAFDTACTENQCQKATGTCQQVAVHQGGQCDADGNPCTANDWCDAGSCKPGALICDCQNDADCVGKEGADLCVGPMYCDKAKHECVPIKKVQCDTSGDGPCTHTACVPKTGACVQTALADGTLCAGNTLCTGVQICASGACVTGEAVNCDDVNPCTVDSCEDKQGGCLHQALDGPSCEDGSACTTGDVCKAGACVGTTLPCNDNEACTDDACDPAKGCVHLSVGVTDCDDGDPCTLGDACAGGVCVGVAGKVDCDDGNPCTVDGCTAKVGCSHNAAPLEGQPCSDGEVCTVQDSCAGGACVGLGKNCDDAEPCTVDDCIKGVGCVHDALQKGACDDNDACTTGDGCKSGSCVGAATLDCDDNESCTVDTCVPSSGCKHVALAAGAACSDANPCTNKDHCSQGKCVGAAVNCDDDNVCTEDACSPELGKCTNLPNAVEKCEDGDVCTVGDVCKGGACKGGKLKPCDDANVCTLDSCDSLKDCVHQGVVGTICDDGSACTEGDACAGTSCTGKTKACGDDNDCTTDACDPKSGCTNVPKAGSACNDNDACTEKDACTGGKCVGAALNCDDGNSCTKDSCNTTAGCKNELLDKVPCDDGSTCTVDDTCDSGICKATSALWSKVVSLNPATESVYDATLDSTGALVLVGYHRVGDSVDNNATDRFVTRFDETGKQVYFSSPPNTGEDHYEGIAAGADGDVYCVGQSETANQFFSSKNFFLARVNIAGAQIWSRKIGDPDYGRDVAVVGDKDVVAIAEGGSKVTVLSFDRESGGTLWTNAPRQSGWEGQAVARIGATDVIASGYASNQSVAWAARLDGSGNVLWNHTLSGATDSGVEIFTAQPLGTQVVLGGGVGGDPLLLTLSGDGQVADKQLVKGVESSAFYGLDRTPDGGLLGTGPTGLLVRVGASGTIVWTRSLFVQDGSFTVRGGGERTDGTLLVGGRSVALSVADAGVRRLDRWGNATCTGSGSCYTKPLSSCDDKNPCTLDGCSVSQGNGGACTHATVQDATPCGGGKICIQGSCKAP
ncbi:MAG: hypothetical protein H6747_06815 [Deltaproteobacteria bacterium]|nr:hypothetical protein [Deltaproteobacteria bacterium]